LKFIQHRETAGARAIVPLLILHDDIGLDFGSFTAWSFDDLCIDPPSADRKGYWRLPLRSFDSIYCGLRNSRRPIGVSRPGSVQQGSRVPAGRAATSVRLDLHLLGSLLASLALRPVIRLLCQLMLTQRFDGARLILVAALSFVWRIDLERLSYGNGK
jgi:hypothetical protein